MNSHRRSTRMVAALGAASLANAYDMGVSIGLRFFY
jgi:hypothetical protein